MEAIKPVRVAVIGCGAISGIYFENMTRRFSILEVAACCDLNEQLAQAVSAQDKASFTRASGVGPKLAARIVTELKDKIVTIPVTDSLKEIEMNPTQETENYEDSIAVLSANEDPAKLEDAISALVNLGYQRLEAYKAVNKAAMADPDTDTSGLIKLALKEFARKEV